MEHQERAWFWLIKHIPLIIIGVAFALSVACGVSVLFVPNSTIACPEGMVYVQRDNICVEGARPIYRP
jgi:hypothetical protein